MKDSTSMATSYALKPSRVVAIRSDLRMGVLQAIQFAIIVLYFWLARAMCINMALVQEDSVLLLSLPVHALLDCKVVGLSPQVFEESQRKLYFHSYAVAKSFCRVKL